MLHGAFPIVKNSFTAIENAAPQCGCCSNLKGAQHLGVVKIMGSSQGEGHRKVPTLDSQGCLPHHPIGPLLKLLGHIGHNSILLTLFIGLCSRQVDSYATFHSTGLIHFGIIS